MASPPDAPGPAPGARNVTLADLAALLKDQQARQVDVVAPAAAIRASHGQLEIEGTDPVLDSSGVTISTGTYTPTEVCDQGLADKPGIPAAYLRRTREQRPTLYDANVNGWLGGDPRKFLIRCLRPETGTGPGAARAFLSDGYKRIDNLDVLMAALDGVRQAGVPAGIDGCDLTERRMYVRVVCEQVRALAPALLAGYRSIAEAAFTYAAGHPDNDYARGYGRSVIWRCSACDSTITDRGPCNGPADDEYGHAPDCRRLEFSIEAWDASWEAGE